jgi:tRNA(Ile2) C34 agmatinyltransferase TiaS
MSSNPVTGDSLVSKIGSKEQKQKFDEGFDRIFRKKDPICNVCGKTLASTKECAWTGCQLNWNEDRVDTIGQNGNDGLHYDDV